MYGNAPKDLGLINLSPTEMMFWLYCPIKEPGSYAWTMPENLDQFEPIVHQVFLDCDHWRSSYIYLTAKTLWVQPDAQGNRLSWYADGFGTDHLNYIWYDANPTVFWVPPSTKHIHMPSDHAQSMKDMTLMAEGWPQYQRRYPCKHLLRLDQTVIHAVDPVVHPGMRSFVKVSVSDKPYALEGNSINHELNPRAA